MRFEKIYLRSDDPDIFMDAYIPTPHWEIKIPPRPAVIVIPGGGYRCISGREGDPVARKFLGDGIVTFLLSYSIKEKAVQPRQILDASLAVEHIRKNAEEYGVDPEKIIVCGFSAGGHLAASIGTLWDRDYAKTSPDMEYGINRPNGMILCYPVINVPRDMDSSRLHGDTVYGDPATEMGAELSQLDLQVKAGITPPAYIWTTFGDTLVPPENSINFALAMQKQQIPYELHVFNHGVHGLALATREVGKENGDGIFPHDIATWIDEAIVWVKNL